MSHWRKYNASVLENVKMDMLEKAAAEMGIQIDHNVKQVRNSYGESGRVDAGIKMNGKVLPLGFIFKTENGKTTLQLEGDFWETGLNERTFLDQLSQSYQKHNIMAQAQQQGWFFDVNKTDAEGNIVLEAYQWA